jgi:DNA-directed RNA polymerase specialized sigma24 family protein
VERAWRDAREQLQGRKLIIDLRNVTLISREGEHTLLKMMRDGAMFFLLRRFNQACAEAVGAKMHALKRFVGPFPPQSNVIRIEEGILMFAGGKFRQQQPSPYATRGDFCRIFAKDMNRLYLLSFLLTADEAVAEQCFVGGLHTAQEGNPVFKEWAEAWARRTIILNAIRMIRPRLTADSTEPFGRVAGNAAAERAEIADIVKLPAFERFVFVMSVLEEYSDRECALHLVCARAEIRAARTRAFKQMGRVAEFRRPLVGIASRQKQQTGDSESQFRLQEFSGLVASP